MRVTASPSRAARARRRFWRELRRDVEGYVVIGPWLVGFLVFTLGPMAASAVLAFTNYDLLTPPEWTGLTNYRRSVGDPLIPLVLYNTAYYTLLAVPAQVAVALVMALLLNIRVRGVNLFRTAYYLPTVTPAVASVLLWVWIYHPEFGLANAILRTVGLPTSLWLRSPEMAKESLVIMSLWGVGSQMVIFLAGLQGVPETLHEAAQIDGATWLQRLRHVTIPMISPVIFFNVIVGMIGSFQVFTAAFIATGGGPIDSTRFYVLYLYEQGFQSFRMGYASFLAWVLFALILLFTLAQFALGRRWVYYEGNRPR